MAANASLLSDMSDKLADYCRTYFKLDDRQLSSEEMGEFYYAFNKANAFSSSTPREASRASHRMPTKKKTGPEGPVLFPFHAPMPAQRPGWLVLARGEAWRSDRRASVHGAGCRSRLPGATHFLQRGLDEAHERTSCFGAVLLML